MYTYRKLSREQQRALLAWRRSCRRALHEPPHFAQGVHRFLLSAACFEHADILTSAGRLTMFSEALCEVCASVCLDVHAWVVLPNHYHVLVTGDLVRIRPALGKLHNRTSTIWNREDKRTGRRVWYRFGDRRIRSDGHFYAATNYLHANPVRHKRAKLATDWPWSSLHAWLDECGDEYMRALWMKYPVGEFGKGWDEP